MDDKNLSLHNNMKEPPLIYYKPKPHLTTTQGFLGYSTASQVVLDTYIHILQLLKLRLNVSNTNIGPGFVLPQGY